MKTETIYVDSRKRCHRIDYGAMTPVETDFFIGKCDAFVEGHICDDSMGYRQIYPWRPYAELDKVQRAYEKEMLADSEKALAILFGGETV